MTAATVHIITRFFFYLGTAQINKLSSFSLLLSLALEKKKEENSANEVRLLKKLLSPMKLVHL